MYKVLTIFLFFIIEYYQTLILIAITSIVLHWVICKKNLPPGPWSIPIFGYLLFLIGPQHLTLTRLNKKYGNIISFYLGNVLVIVLGDYKSIQEAFVKQGFLFSGKPDNSLQKIKVGKTNGGLGVIEGEMARQHRRFILSTLKNFATKKSSLEQSIMVVIKWFLSELESTKGQPTDLRFLKGLSMAKIIGLFEFGNTLSDTTEFLYEMRDLTFQSSNYIGIVGLKMILPWAICITFIEKITGLKNFKKRINEVYNVMYNLIKKKEEMHNEDNNSDYVDAYIKERNRLLAKNGSEGYFSEKELLGNAMALFGAGISTSVNYLLWAIIFMLKYPNVRQKVEDEIDEIIGRERNPVMADKNLMTYTEATLLEVHRLSSVVPLSLAHSNMEETTLFGYHIPKRSYVLANLWAVHHDVHLWNDPYEFKPERFIDQNGKINKPDYLIPFSIGKRNCIGEILANTTTFLYFVSLFQRFDIQLPKGDTICLESTFDTSLKPKPFKVCCYPH